MYCGNEIFIDHSKEKPIVNEFNFDHYYDLMAKAYEGKNYSESYKYATKIIEETEDKQTLAPVWVYKGWSAGYLSTLNKPRIEEMVNHIKTAINLNKDSLDLEVVIGSMVYILYYFNYDLFAAWNDNIVDDVRNRPKTMVVPSQKSISESIGAGLGAGIGQAISDNMDAKQRAKKFGERYQATYMKTFNETIKFAWSMNKTKSVAQHIIFYVRDVITASCIDSNTKNIVVDNLEYELKDLREKYSDLSLPEIKGDGCGCSPCFIATAVMKDSDHPYVNLLRQFRDEILEKHLLGKIFIDIYYRICPPISKIIYHHDSLRFVLFKVLIAPLVVIANNSIKRNRKNNFDKRMKLN